MQSATSCKCASKSYYPKDPHPTVDAYFAIQPSHQPITYLLITQIRRPPPVFSASPFPQRWDRLPPQARLRPRPPSLVAPRQVSCCYGPTWSSHHGNFSRDLTPALWSDLELDARVFAGHHFPSCYFNTGVLVMDLRRYCQHMQWWMETQKEKRTSPVR
jgi:hypothetical protein